MRKTYLVTVALCAAAGLAGAQEAAKPAARNPRIAIIDMAAISSQSALGKSYAARIETLEKQIQAEGTKKQAELQKLDAAIKALQEELEKQATVLSAEAADKKRQEITRKARERQAFLEDGQQELQRMKERAEAEAGGWNQEFQQKVKPHVEAVAKDRGIDILLTSQVALTMNPEFDISKDVIARLDANEKVAAAPAAAKPAAAAPAAARPAASPSPSTQK
ncbi:MAG TPA: OmpH family outer membrane protein [Vicinamibacteria bacterium]|nr:OmpH family outer membrane protein [Vicinamibacteria bacterium]